MDRLGASELVPAIASRRGLLASTFSMTRNGTLRIAILATAISMGGCAPSASVVAPIDRDDPLPTAAPDEVGLDARILDNIADQLARDDHDIHSMLVVRHGRVAMEQYWNGFTRDNPHDIRSATKSITALLTGTAIDRGYLAGVNAPVMDYLQPGYPTIRDKGEIRVEHLLTMSSGLDCDDADRSTRGQEDRMYRSEDWVGYFLSLDRRYPPGDSVRYCTGGVVALGEAIARASGRDFEAFADEALFAPLGIRNYRWARFDGQTKVDTGGHLLLTPQAMARIGMLVLDGGKWEGVQVVPEAWIREMLLPRSELRGTPYGYLWWSDQATVGAGTVDVVWAQGNGGQTIFIVPDYDLVAVFTTGYFNSDRARSVFALFASGVLPAVVDNANPAN